MTYSEQLETKYLKHYPHAYRVIDNANIYLAQDKHHAKKLQMELTVYGRPTYIEPIVKEKEKAV